MRRDARRWALITFCIAMVAVAASGAYSSGIASAGTRTSPDDVSIKTPTPTPTPTPTLTRDPVIMAAGDIACGAKTSPAAPCAQMATSNLMVNAQPDAVLTLGGRSVRVWRA